MANPYAIAEGRRIEITQEQSRQIRDMYQQIRQEFASGVDRLSRRDNISSIMRTQYLNEFQKDLESEIKVLNARLEGIIKSNTLEMARAVVLDSDNLAREMGFSGIFTNEYNIPNQVVNDLISGKLYEGKWTLSKAIWSDNQKKLDDINSIIAKGVAENKPTYDIAKDLERYVNPRARKDWAWSKVYPGSTRKIDYNAQRLARTMVSHAYQESFVQSTKDNPFIESYRWLASGGDRMCDLCAERDGKIFAKDELPMDHPNGMCTFEVVIEKSYDQIAQDLHNWIYGEGDPNLDAQLDDYAESLGYNVKVATSQNPQIQNIDKQLQIRDIGYKWEEKYLMQDARLENELTDKALSIFNDEELRAINAYTGTQNALINRYERYGSNVPKIVIENAKTIERALDKITLGTTVVSKRGVSANAFYQMFETVEGIKGWKIGDDVSKLVGKSFIEKGFYSSSLIGGGFDGKVEIVSLVSNSIHGAYIAQIANNELEKELLLQKGYNYDIVKAEYEDNKLKLWVIVNKK